MGQKALFSIIIPSLNEEVNLPVLLKSIANQTHMDFEIIINDSGSSDLTKELSLQFQNTIPNLRFVEYKSKNVSQARNHGASLAVNNWLIFFDADVEIEKDFIKEIQSHIQTNALDALTVWNRPKTNNIKGVFTLALLNASMTVFQKIKPAANGPCIIMKKTLFESLNGFDDSIFFGEDFDIIQRAHKKGARFRVFTTPILYVSTRRFEKEGLFTSFSKSIKALFYQFIFGPIRKPIFEYEMGGQYYKKNIKS